MKIRILYEDNHLIAVEKLPGLLTQGDESGENSLLEEVRKLLKEKYNKPGQAFVGLLHRLDRNVGGIVLFAKTSKGASRLSKQFREHTIGKAYVALVEGRVTEAQPQTLRHHLQKDQGNNRVTVKDQPFEQSKEAILTYTLRKHLQNTSLLRVQLQTGRSHQIRAQLAHVGHPIVGDIKYGSTTRLPDRSIRLYATDLSFITATDEKEIHLTIDPPKEWGV